MTKQSIRKERISLNGLIFSYEQVEYVLIGDKYLSGDRQLQTAPVGSVFVRKWGASTTSSAGDSHEPDRVYAIPEEVIRNYPEWAKIDKSQLIEYPRFKSSAD